MNYKKIISFHKRKWEFLNENLINAISNQILSHKSKYDHEYFHISQFLTKIRADLAELKGSYDPDYFEEPRARNKLMGYLIFDKLLSQLKREIIHKTGRNDILKSYNEAIRTLLLSRFPQEKTEQSSYRRDDKYKNSYKGKEDTEKPALQNFATYFQKPYCILCDMNSHKLSSCKRYSFEEKKREIRFMQQMHHKNENCPKRKNGKRLVCLKCNSKCHISELCDKP